MSVTKSIRTVHVRPRTLRRRLVAVAAGGVLAMTALGYGLGDHSRADAIEPVADPEHGCMVFEFPGDSYPQLGGGLR